jgi:hypothetical protein
LWDPTDPCSFCQELTNRINAANGTACFQPGYDPIADVNKDKVVDGGDSGIVARCGGNEACCQALWDPTDPCAACSVSFDKNSYTLGETMHINFSTPPAVTCNLQLLDPSSNVIDSWTGIGAGVMDYPLKATDPTGTWTAHLWDTGCNVSDTATVLAGVPACSWQNDACGAPCSPTERHQTCGPAGCSGNCDGQPAGSTRCIADPTCVPPPCTCNAWVNDACGAGGCSANQMHQTRTCNPAGCDTESQCVADPACAPPPPIFHLTNPLACNTIPECIEKIISFILWIAGAILPIIIIIAGFLFLTSGGDPEKVRTAKRMIFWAVIGLAIISLAKGIISLIESVISK